LRARIYVVVIFEIFYRISIDVFKNPLFDWFELLGLIKRAFFIYDIKYKYGIIELDYIVILLQVIMIL
jgi:hypothetical protein